MSALRTRSETACLPRRVSSRMTLLPDYVKKMVVRHSLRRTRHQASGPSRFLDGSLPAYWPLSNASVARGHSSRQTSPDGGRSCSTRTANSVLAGSVSILTSCAIWVVILNWPSAELSTAGGWTYALGVERTNFGLLRFRRLRFVTGCAVLPGFSGCRPMTEPQVQRWQQEQVQERRSHQPAQDDHRQGMLDLLTGFDAANHDGYQGQASRQSRH